MASTPRPTHHFTPARNWMNDPNGLIHHGGRWHLFFQHNPFGIDWGHMSWGHASSPDLETWTEHPVAIPWAPGEHVYSGSAVADGDTLTAVYTSVAPDRRQTQALATSSDGGLTWERYPGNPVLDRGSKEFRDPKVFRHGDHWVMAAVEAEKHLVVLYRSVDLRSWELLSELPIDLPDVRAIECPDLFPLPYGDGERWVLVVSLLPDTGSNGRRGSATRYCVGDFDGTEFRPGTPLRLVDHGPDHYAAATFTDAPDGRRISIAWMSNWAYAKTVPTDPWRGAMTLPRELALVERDGGPVLAQAPVTSLEPVAVTDRLDVGDVHLAVADGRLRLERDTLPASVDVEVDGPVRAYVDRGSVEVFSADGTVAVTALTFR